MANRVPQTLVKLSQQLMLLGYHQMDDTPNPFDNLSPLSIFQTITSIRVISATNRFRVVQDRSNRRRQGIGSSVEAFGVVPGQVTTTIEMDRVVLNTEDAMGAFQFLPGNIAFQIRPLVILEVTIPAIGENGLPVIRTATNAEGFGRDLQNVVGSILAVADVAKSPTYTNCWVASSSLEYKLEGAQAVAQNVTLTVGNVSPAVAVVFPSIQDFLVTNLPIVTRGIEITRSIGRIV